MTSYTIELSNDVLKIGFAEPAQNHQIVQDAALRLDQLIASGELAGGELSISMV